MDFIDCGIARDVGKIICNPFVFVIDSIELGG